MDLCSAMTKQGSVMLICDLPKGHYPESDHEDSTKKRKWREERWAGEGERHL